MPEWTKLSKPHAHVHAHTQLNSGHFATWHSGGKSNNTILGNSPKYFKTSSHSKRKTICALPCAWIRIVLKIWIICNQGLRSSYKSPQHMWQKQQNEAGTEALQSVSWSLGKGFGQDSGCQEERKSRPSQPFSTTIIEALFPQNTISVLLPQRRMTLNLAEFKCSPTCIRDRSVLLAMTSPSISGIPRARHSLPKIQLVYGLYFAHQRTLVLVKELQSAVAEPRICFQTVLYFVTSGCFLMLFWQLWCCQYDHSDC